MLRDVNCGELRRKDVGREVRIAGWVRKIRDHGEIVFIDLWDRYGKTQVVFSGENIDLRDSAKDIGLEWVILVKGKVRDRPEDMVNEELPTGDVELEAEEIEILNHSEVPPFVVKEEVEAEKELRLRHRYLELRRDRALKGFKLRHNLMQITRKILNERKFIEVETPILGTPTPEGARDFLVPSRMNPGRFYSLAQSPQLYKQILMISGFDRYYQFARCFRDEDMRGDRQLEHTQIDLEMSYAESEDIYEIGEELLSEFIRETKGVEIETPILKISYREAMERFGTDKPDLRNPLEIEDYTEIAQEGDFGIFNSSKKVRGIKVSSTFSRSEIDELEEVVKKAGAKGLLYLINDGGEYRSPFLKYYDDPENFNLEEGETLFLVAGSDSDILKPLGGLRNRLGEKLELLGDGWELLWVVDFPLFEWNEDEDRWAPAHHIFTQPKEIGENIEENPGDVTAKHYDLVLNGVELGSGSIRNHDPELQRKLLKIIGMTDEEIEEKFGFFLKALKYGAPPHGGIALGFDRICMLLAEKSSITEVITFPKTLSGLGLMEGSPGPVTEEQLKELNLELKKNE